jgi:hypothetical protein
VKDERALIGLCAGFEGGKWRASQFADHLIEWLPEFALSPEERKTLKTHNAVARIRQAARTVYTTPKYQKRGEFGELLLHVALRQVFGTSPAVSRIFYKDAPNDTVKGFDCVHVVDSPNGLELWLGEAKLYEDGAAAIAAAAASIKEHMKADYLRQEFVAIGRKLPHDDHRTTELQHLLHRNNTLDVVVKRIVIPVLIAHDSPTTAKHAATTQQYREELAAECRSHRDDFVSATSGLDVRIHLIMLPLSTKATLVKELDGRLRALQQL